MTMLYLQTSRVPLAAMLVLAACNGTAGRARAGEVLGVLDRTTGILAPTAAALASPATAAAPPITRIGTLKVTCLFTIGPEIPPSTTIGGFVSIATSDPTFTNQVTISGTMSRSGKTGTLTLNLPYYWTLASAGETIALQAEVNAASPSGNYYDVSQMLTIPLPKTGVTTTVNINGAM